MLQMRIWREREALGPIAISNFFLPYSYTAQDKRKEEHPKMSPEVALNRISPALSPFISSVVRNGKVGLDATNCLRITDLKSG